MSITSDPLHAEKPGKRDADPETGQGGDDGVDALMAAVVSHGVLPERPPVDPTTLPDDPLVAGALHQHRAVEWESVVQQDGPRDALHDLGHGWG